MAEIHHEIKVRAEPDRIREALTSPTSLEAWHGGRVTVANGGLRFEFADGAPTFRWAIEPAKSGAEIVWRCLEGPGDSVGTEASFKFSPADKGRTLVEFAHRGWPHTGGNFRKCNTTWAILLHHLRQYIESGKADPALRAPA
jgi:Activator of Hsp90 ATPase homolog 1-like protein